MRAPPTFDRGRPFGSLLALLATLRGPDGCPWDREQTAADHLDHLAKEAEEARAALDAPTRLVEEAADVFLNAAMLLVAASEGAGSDPASSLQALHAKLVRRHPHVFGEETATTPAEAVAAWNRAKAAE